MTNSEFRPESNTWVVNLNAGAIRLSHIHPQSKCAGEGCIVHNPSDTRANREGWPYSFREDGLRIERTCPHGVGHPDVDHLAYLVAMQGGDHWGGHGCDGCCVDEA